MMSRFMDIINRISPKLHGITYKLNGHFSFFNEDDLYQEAVVHLWIMFKKGELEDKTDSYILQGCFFHLKNYLRKTFDKYRLQSLESLMWEEGLGLDNFIAHDSDSLIDTLDEESLKEELLKKRLSNRERIVLLSSIDGLTVRAIGKRLGISHVMVVKIKKGIRKKLNFFRTKSLESYQN